MSAGSRRAFLAGAAVVGTGWVAGCRHRAGQGSAGQAGAGQAPALNAAFTGSESLKSHAAARGFLYGCAVDVQALKADAGYRGLVEGQCNIVVAENAMKWGPLRPAVDRYAFEEADALVAFAEQHGMKVRGHNLCWHRQLPGWFAKEATPENARRLLTEHIQHVAGRYAGRMQSWDVVNEAVEVKDGRGDGLRDSPWLQLLGPEYLEVAFRAARAADAQALLTYNDYGIEEESAEAGAKRAAVLALLRRMRARRVPLDAVGVQSHLTAGKKYGAGLKEFMAAVREMGLQIFITEMDVNDRELPAETDARDKAVAETYAGYLEMVLAEPAVRAVLTWGISDRLTWLNHEEMRADKLPERCLPFTAEDQPAPAFFAMRKAFDGRRI